MRLVLQKGRQRKLIELAKKEKTWNQLGQLLNTNPVYLCHDLRLEKILISQETYKRLCNITQQNFDKFILERREDNWGRSRGGINSIGSLKKIPKIKFDEKLSEFVGAVLGDGHVGFYKKGKKIGAYHVRIAGDLIKDKDYHTNYLKPLCENLFKLKAREILCKKHNERFLDISSKELVNFFSLMGINPGNKITNQSTIPTWIFKETKHLKACVRGLIDTDGSIFRMSKRDSNLIRIGFTNHDKTLLIDTREAFVRLEFHPSKIIRNRTFCISRQGEITKYLKEIGFSNKKHKDRLKKFKNSPFF